MSRISELPSWYDRNPVDVLQRFYQLGVAEHLAKTRWSYVVPFGKIAFVEIMTCKICRAEAAGTAGLVYANISIDIEGKGAPWTMMLAHIRTNGVGDKDGYTIGHSAVLLEKDVMKATTFDSSSGGEVDYLLAVKMTEFDAIRPIDKEIVMELPKPDIQEPKKPSWWPF